MLPLSAARNPFTAMHVAEVVMDERTAAFARRNGRQPTAFEWAVLWRRPGHRGPVTGGLRSYAARFENLATKGTL